MSTLRKWTEDEEKVVISKIEENPNNLQRAFREASLEIGLSVLMTGAKSMEWRNHCHLWLLMY